MKSLKKFFLLSVYNCFFYCPQAQKMLPNKLIGKNETEILSISYLSKRGVTLGGQVIYRFPYKKNYKIGFGISGAIDGDDVKFYGTAFADGVYFIGERQKWAVNGQVGYGFYNYRFSGMTSTVNVDSKEKGGMLYLAGISHRAIVGKIQIVTGGFITLNTFDYYIRREFLTPPTSVSTNEGKSRPLGGGIRLGIVF